MSRLASPPDLPTERNFTPAAVEIAIPAASSLLDQAWQRMPSAGQVVFGFTLVRELGRGAFGRVFLATQPELAGRVVALKVSADLLGESRTLALLQHTNIVPVYSVHHGGALQAVCMPYFGPTTLADVLRSHRGRNALPATGREFVNTLKGLSGLTATDADQPPAPPRPTNAESIYARLSGLSYARAVCWLGARLADGLAHAHDRGILHRDIKPANVLVTDDGQPMLLDFGIAEEMRARVTGGAVGGTLPYMAPEALDEILTGTPSADARSDIYALGLVLFELLTGSYPFRLSSAAGETAIRRMADERREAAPRLRPLNAAVTPGLESIVRTCLDPDPARRYPSAAALRDDLDLYFADEPLAFAREPSVGERVAKWSRRHPRVTSSFTLSLVAAGLLIAAGFAISSRNDRLARLEAERTYHALLEQSRQTHYMLFVRNSAHQPLAEGTALCRRLLGFYGALDHDDWDRRKAFTALDPTEQARVRQELADACVLMARGYAARAGTDPDALAEAIRVNQRAEAIAGEHTPREVFLQRAGLMRDAKRDADAAEALRRHDAAPEGDEVRRTYAQALKDQISKKHPEAIAKFRAVQALDPKHYWAYYGEGLSHGESDKWADARGCYTAAVALWPAFHWGYFNRAMACNELGDFAAAEADFTKALGIRPDFADAYLGRAKARNMRRDFEGALADLDAAAGLHVAAERFADLRGKLLEATGRAPRGENEPDDEDGWINRGLARMEKKDAAGASEAFRQASELNPKSARPLLFRVYALDTLGKPEECLELLERAVRLAPNDAASLASRGVFRARLKQWDGARADAEAALSKSATASNLYQVAGVYARLAEHDRGCLGEAVLLLGVALRAGFGFDLLPTDPELDPIRKTPEFEGLMRDVARFRRPMK
jgi:serine/threonine protein kinase/Tfp pilus assembly protein PilF